MRVSTTATIVMSLLLVSARVDAQTLDEARELYASAEYDRALAVLDGLSPSNRSRDEQQSIELYRVLCLLATGKDANARSAMERLITTNPSFRPSNDLPPRVRAVYHDTRRALLPAAIQTAYQEARAAFELKDYATAERGFAVVLEVLSDPDLQALAGQAPLADIRTLAAGFHELSAKAAAPPPVAVPPPAPVPVAAMSAPAPAVRPVSAPAPAARPAPAPAATPVQPSRAPKVYTAADTNVVPPTPLNQQLPGFPGQVRAPQTGIVEVVIDTAGRVESAKMAASVNPQYDRMAVVAARSWQYEPARLDGTPVKFVKRIQVNLIPND